MAAKMKATEQFSKVIYDELSCPICLEIFVEPKSLPKCAHNICRECLNSIAAKQRGRNRPKKVMLECPICRKQCKIPSGGVDGFPTNKLLKRLVEHRPGTPEKQAIRNAIDLCSKKLQETKNKLLALEKDQERVVETSKDRCLEMQKQIASSADLAIKCIREEERELVLQVKKYLEERCETYRKMYGDEHVFYSLSERTKEHLNQVEESLKSMDPEVILQCKDAIVDQIQEAIDAMEISVDSPFEVSSLPFNLQYRQTKKRRLLGIVIKDGEAQTEELEDMESCPLEGVGTCTSAPGEPETNGLAGNKIEDVQSGGVPTGRIYLPGHLTASPFIQASENTYSSTQLKSMRLIKEVRLRFPPTSFAVSQIIDRIAILCAVLCTVHLYNTSGKHLRTIHIEMGVLTDVAFTSNDEVVVVNRASNRLLHFTKFGTFLPRFIKCNESDIKLTSVSVDNTGRFILTSTPSEGPMDKGIGRACVLVLTPNREFSFVFGEGHLQNPYGKAIYHSKTFYVPDSGTSIKSFDASGVFLFQWSQESPNPHLHLAINTLDNTLLIVNQAQKKITIYNQSGAHMSVIPLSAGRPMFVEVVHEKSTGKCKVIVMYLGVTCAYNFLEIYTWLP